MHTLNWFTLIKVILHHSLSLLVFLVPLVWRVNLLCRQLVTELSLSCPKWEFLLLSSTLG